MIQLLTQCKTLTENKPATMRARIEKLNFLTSGEHFSLNVFARTISVK
jgi:hypothetical protein